MAKVFDKVTVDAQGKTYVHVDANLIRVYDKREAMEVLGIAHPAQVTQLITNGKITAVGYVPVSETSGTTKLLLDANSVDEYKLVMRTHNSSGVHRYEVAISPDDLDAAVNELISIGSNGCDLAPLLHALQHAKDLTSRSAQYMRERKARKEASEEGVQTGTLHLAE